MIDNIRKQPTIGKHRLVAKKKKRKTSATRSGRRGNMMIDPTYDGVGFSGGGDPSARAGAG